MIWSAPFLLLGLIAAGFAGDGMGTYDFAREEERRRAGMARFKMAAVACVVSGAIGFTLLALGIYGVI